jgi:glycosyltransferase involved in cell wall biosynthesis
MLSVFPDSELEEQPLVSVGIPTYNRAHTLKRTLECITQQTYKNLEIIVSDNASPNEETSNLVKQFQQVDNRIVFYEHESNLGAIVNFGFVAKQAKGGFFMWAADDDEWAPWFVERCVRALQKNQKAIAVGTEAQYFSEKGLFPFFKEGVAFYKPCIGNEVQRVKHLLDNNYGNLVYGVFRKQALMLDGKMIWECMPGKSLNEIPMLLYAASQGAFIILPEVGFYKYAPLSTCKQAQWEMEGGRLPKSLRIPSLVSAKNTWKYHQAALADIEMAIAYTSIPKDIWPHIKRYAQKILGIHFLMLIIGWKPKSGRKTISCKRISI